MTRSMKRLALAAAVPAIAAAILVSLAIPPAQLELPAPRPDGSVRGVLHVHTDRSDGHGSLDEVAAAAARAGLAFIVFTDHGGAASKPEPPAYRSGVLCIDAVEISTAGGHVIALGMDPSPYPLAGEPRDVVEDIHRLGGFAIAAHPDSPKPELRWRDWDVPVDAVETMNLDTGWRVWATWAGWGGNADAQAYLPDQPGIWRARGRLAASLLGYPFRPVETIGRLVPTAAEERYLALTQTRRVVSLAGADAHGTIAYRGDPAEGGPSLPIPSYESTFRAMSVHVTPERPLTGDPVEDAQLLTAAIRAGHAYNALEALAAPAAVEFTATGPTGAAAAGDELRLTGPGPVTLRVRSNIGPDFMTAVMNGAKDVKGSFEQEFTVDVTEPGAYWVRSTSTNPKTLGATWIRTNPIYIRGAAGEPGPSPDSLPPHTSSWSLFDGVTNSDWSIEHDPKSEAALDVARLVDGPALRLRYGLGGGVGTSPFVALVHGTPDGTTATGRLAFTIRAEQPMRMWVQARVPDGEGERWQRSIYVDASPREYSIGLDSLIPAGTTRTPKPPFSDVRTLLFVIDTVNTRPGASGRVWISRVRYEQ